MEVELTDNLIYLLIPLAMFICLLAWLCLLVNGKRQFNLRVSGLGIKIALESNRQIDRKGDLNE